MSRIATTCLLVSVVASSRIAAQSVAQRIRASDGNVQVIYPSRPSACGDGTNFIGNVFGQSTYYSGTSTYSGSGSWSSRACVHGPARAVVSVIGGEVTRIHVYVGPVPSSNVTTINASAADASAWLADVVAHGSAKVASDAMLPLVLVDAPGPWPALLSVARDDNRPLSVRRSALTWVSNGVTEHLGLVDEHADTDDDEMRKQAVFVLSQRPKSESVPELIDLARSSKHAAVRRAAIFWLGQTGDMRAVDVYADLLK